MNTRLPELANAAPVRSKSKLPVAPANCPVPPVILADPLIVKVPVSGSTQVTAESIWPTIWSPVEPWARVRRFTNSGSSPVPTGQSGLRRAVWRTEQSALRQQHERTEIVLSRAEIKRVFGTEDVKVSNLRDSDNHSLIFACHFKELECLWGIPHSEVSPGRLGRERGTNGQEQGDWAIFK